MKPKYAVYPGYVTSKSDGDRHYIGPMQLISLYGVDGRECIICEPSSQWGAYDYQRAAQQCLGLIPLKPQYNGNYSLPQ